MQSFFKTIAVLSIMGLTPMIIAMDPEKKHQAAINEAQKIKTAIVEANASPKAVVPVIEPAHKGYLCILPSRAAKISEFIPGYLEGYKTDFPELGADIDQTSLMVDCWVSSQPTSEWNEDPKPWHAHSCPHLPAKSNGMNFPNQLPVQLLQGLHEGDTRHVKVKGVLFALKCSQLKHRYKSLYLKEPLRFEQLLAQVTSEMSSDKKENGAEKESAS